MSSVPPDLIAAYHAAIYEVEVAPGRRLAVRIGQPDAALDRLLAKSGAREAAFLTAYNPASAPLCEAESQAADETLLQELRRRGLDYTRARGIDPRERWPDEPGFLVFAVTRDEAADLARRFDQNGFVTVAIGAPPELVLVR